MHNRAGALLPLLAIACGSTLSAHRPLGDDVVAQLNEAIGNRRATVELEKQPPLAVKDVRFGRDRTLWLQLHPPDDWRESAVPTEVLRSVSFRRSTAVSLLAGGGIGLAAGAAAGLAIGAAAANPQADSQKIEYSVAGLFIGALSGLAVGLATGAAVGERATIQFGER